MPSCGEVKKRLLIGFVFLGLCLLALGGLLVQALSPRRAPALQY